MTDMIKLVDCLLSLTKIVRDMAEGKISPGRQLEVIEILKAELEELREETRQVALRYLLLNLTNSP